MVLCRPSPLLAVRLCWLDVATPCEFLGGVLWQDVAQRTKAAIMVSICVRILVLFYLVLGHNVDNETSVVVIVFLISEIAFRSATRNDKFAR